MNDQTLSKWLSALTAMAAAGTLPEVEAVFPPPPPAHDTPDANGFVLLAGITNPDYANLRHCVRDVVRTLPAGSSARAIGIANVRYADTAYQTENQSILVGHSAVESTDPDTGNVTWSVDQTKTLTGTYAWPDVVHQGHDLATPQGVVSWVNTLSPRATNQGQGFTP